jgi:hypothetical protein
VYLFLIYIFFHLSFKYLPRQTFVRRCSFSICAICPFLFVLYCITLFMFLTHSIQLFILYFFQSSIVFLSLSYIYFSHHFSLSLTPTLFVLRHFPNIYLFFSFSLLCYLFVFLLQVLFFFLPSLGKFFQKWRNRGIKYEKFVVLFNKFGNICKQKQENLGNEWSLCGAIQHGKC